MSTNDTIWTLFHQAPGMDQPDRAVFSAEDEALEYLIINYGEPESDHSLTIVEEMQADGHEVHLDEWRLGRYWERVAFAEQM